MKKKAREYTAVYRDMNNPQTTHANGSPVFVSFEVHDEELVNNLKEALSERSRIHGFIPIDQIEIISFRLSF